MAIWHNLIEQVNQIRLLGVVLSDDLTWGANTNNIVNKAYKRMCILRKLYEFNVRLKDLKHIYVIYIRSVVEQSCVVWATSLTLEDDRKIARVRKNSTENNFERKLS